jgi:dTMP kinase
MAGRFITFEGGEGAGKSTQVRRLAAHLADRGQDVAVTREPGGTPIAESIRDFILSGKAKALGAESEAILFAAARADHVDKVIRPALARGAWVLCDRFIDSTRVYQGSADGADPVLVRALEKLAVGDTLPDLTIILDLPAEVGMKRMTERASSPDRFEADDLARHELRRQAYLEIARKEAQRCVVVDAGRSEDEAADSIRRIVDLRLLDRAA